jgi:hypothetical protein
LQRAEKGRNRMIGINSNTIPGMEDKVKEMVD